MPGSTDVDPPATVPSLDFFGRSCGVRPSKIDDETAVAAPQLYVHLYHVAPSYLRVQTVTRIYIHA
jgi:hypothetical protein